MPTPWYGCAAPGGNATSGSRRPNSRSCLRCRFPPRNASQLRSRRRRVAMSVTFASVGGDFVKHAHEIGLSTDGKQKRGGFLIHITDLNALGWRQHRGSSCHSASIGLSPINPAPAKNRMAGMHRVYSKEQPATHTGGLHYSQAVKQIMLVDLDVFNESVCQVRVDDIGHAAPLRNNGRLMANITPYKFKASPESK